MRPSNKYGLQSVMTFEDLKRFLTDVVTNLFQILDNNILFKDNFKCQPYNDLVITAGVVQRITHKLGVIPNGFIVTKQVADNVVRAIQYDQWSTSEIFIISSSTDTINIVIIAG